MFLRKHLFTSNVLRKQCLRKQNVTYCLRKKYLRKTVFTSIFFLRKNFLRKLFFYVQFSCTEKCFTLIILYVKTFYVQTCLRNFFTTDERPTQKKTRFPCIHEFGRFRNFSEFFYCFSRICAIFVKFSLISSFAGPRQPHQRFFHPCLYFRSFHIL